MEQVINTLTTITDLLYQENIPVAYRMLYLILPGMEEAIRLLEALEAMENEDNILLADILQYEILERLREYTEA